MTIKNGLNDLFCKMTQNQVYDQVHDQVSGQLSDHVKKEMT